MPACPHCGFDTGEGATTCPLCGSRTGSSTVAGGSAARAGADRGVAGPAVGWEDPRGTFPSNLVGTWRASLFEPAAFFRGLPYGAPLARPVLYYLIVSVTSAFFVLLWQSVSDSLFPSMALGSSEVGPLVQFFFEPFGALILLGVGTLVLHALALVLAAEPRGIGATLRVFCYAWGPSVFTIVPILGPIVGFVWSVVLLVVGVREAHRTTGVRAAVIVVTPILALLVALLLLIALLIALGLTAGEVLDW